MHKKVVSVLGGSLLVTAISNVQAEEDSIFNRIYLGGHLTGISETTESLHGVRIGADYQINKHFILDVDYVTDTLTIEDNSHSQRHTTLTGGYIYPVSISQAMPSYLFAKGGFQVFSVKTTEGRASAVSDAYTGLYVSGGMRAAVSEKLWSEIELAYRTYSSDIDQTDFLLSAEIGLDLADNVGVSLYTETISDFSVSSVGLTIGYTF